MGIAALLGIKGKIADRRKLTEITSQQHRDSSKGLVCKLGTYFFEAGIYLSQPSKAYHPLLINDEDFSLLECGLQFGLDSWDRR